ncbi:hypothetical protein D3C72_1346380 [compost metagenome]
MASPRTRHPPGQPYCAWACAGTSTYRPQPWPPTLCSCTACQLRTTPRHCPYSPATPTSTPGPGCVRSASAAFTHTRRPSCANCASAFASAGRSSESSWRCGTPTTSCSIPMPFAPSRPTTAYAPSTSLRCASRWNRALNNGCSKQSSPKSPQVKTNASRPCTKAACCTRPTTTCTAKPPYRPATPSRYPGPTSPGSTRTASTCRAQCLTAETANWRKRGWRGPMHWPPS